jgi:hypothetical protein
MRGACIKYMRYACKYSTCVVLVYATLMKLCTGRGDLAGGDHSFLELVYIYTIYDVHNSDHFV